MYSLGLGGQSGLYNYIVMKKHLFFCISAIFCIVLCMAAKPEEHTKPVREVQFSPPNIASVTPAATVTPQSFPSNNHSWYDVNGDGIMDFVGSGSQYGASLYVSNADGYEEITGNGMSFGPALMAGAGGAILCYDQYVGLIDLAGTPLTIVHNDANSKEVLYPVDVNNDGRLSFLKLPNTQTAIDTKRYYTYTGGGMGYESKFECVTLEEYLKDYRPGENSMFFGSLSAAAMFQNMVINYPQVEHTDGTIIETHDINNDGLPDLIDYIHNKIMYNMGGGKYASVDFGGQLLMRDFNGDGIEDYIIYDSKNKSIISYIRQADGELKEKTVIKGYYCGTEIWARDVDGDGDIDVVLPLSSSSSETEFIVVLENKGDGTFKRHETTVESGYLAFACADVDNDGNYEVLLGNRNLNTTAIYTIEKLKVNATPVVIESSPGVYRGGVYVNTVNSTTGKWILYGKPSRGSSIKKNVEIEGNINTMPTAPAKPSFVYEPSTGLLKVSWTPATDAETPAADLTYSLRVGTSPDSEDIVWPDALADGTRRNILGGNMGHALHRVFDVSSWPDGDIYISVQAVDGSNGGSPFSEPVIFTKQQPACEVNVNYKKPFAIYDVCEVRLTSNPLPGYKYTWDFDGAEIVDSDEAAQIYRIRFTTPGEKNIHLTATSPDNTGMGSRNFTIDVISTALKSSNDFLAMRAHHAVDLDEDGVYEISYGKFKMAENGNYIDIPKMYNSHSNIDNFSYAVATDINRDGHADLYCGGQEAANNYCIGINAGDLDLDITIEGIVNDGIQYFDFDNDGNLDRTYSVYEKTFIERNVGGEIPEFESVIELKTGIKCMDVDKDGLIDLIISGVNDNNESGYSIHYNQGDFTFLKDEDNFYKLKEQDGSMLSLLQDFDGNGKLDELRYVYDSYNSYSYYYYIRWDDGEISQLLMEYDPERLGISRLNCINANIDMDNNGFVDILLNQYTSDETSMLIFAIMIGPNRTLTENLIDNEDYRSGTRYVSFENSKEFFVGADGSRYTTNGNPLRIDISNDAPQAPTAVRHSQNKKFVEIEWNHSVDAETPPHAMRYNVSVKRKGATGDGAYLLSPCNGGIDRGLIPTTKQLVDGNRIRIPIASISPGEYEVKVQGVDRMFDSSDFSETYYMTVYESVNIEMPSTTEAGYPTEITLASNADANIDWDGAEILTEAGGHVVVSWDTPGVKTVTVGASKATILVKDKPDATFLAPDDVHAKDLIHIIGSRVADGKWEVRFAKNQLYSWFSVRSEDVRHMIEWSSDDDGNVSARILQTGPYELKHTLYDGFSTSEYLHRFEVAPEIAPIISLVTIDPESGRHSMAFDASSAPAEAAAINLYKETAVKGEYNLLATMPLESVAYIDHSSMPETKASRYKAAYELTYGESGFSTVHRPLHVMINAGAKHSWNLIWTPYEGTVIGTYRILRGSSADALSPIDEVAGSLNSYTDFNAPVGELFYAVEMLPAAKTQRNAISSVNSGNITGSCSNTVSTATVGGQIDMVQSIKIYSLSGESIINIAENKSLELGVRIIPSNPTIALVTWVIMDGSDLAFIDQTGRVTASGNGNGSVTVMAMANDGSGATDIFNVFITGCQSGIDEIEYKEDYNMKAVYDMVTGKILLEGIPVANNGTSTVTVYDISGTAHISTKTTEDYMEIDAQHLSKGIYIVYVASDAGCAHARIIVSC